VPSSLGNQERGITDHEQAHDVLSRFTAGNFSAADAYGEFTAQIDVVKTVMDGLRIVLDASPGLEDRERNDDEPSGAYYCSFCGGRER